VIKYFKENPEVEGASVNEAIEAQMNSRASAIASRPIAEMRPNPKLRPKDRVGLLSRHRWARGVDEPMQLIFNCHKAVLELLFNPNVMGSEEAELMTLSGDDVGVVHAKPALLESQPAEDVSYEARIEFKNEWLAVDQHDLSKVTPNNDLLIKCKVGGPHQPPLILEVVPHTAYACVIGRRVELRPSPMYIELWEAQRKRMGGALASVNALVNGGCATVVEIMEDDRVKVRLDNSETCFTMDASPECVRGTSSPRYAEGTLLMLLYQGHLIDAVVTSALEKDRGSRHKLKRQDDNQEIEVDLNHLNHSPLRRVQGSAWGSVATFEEARRRYCATLESAHQEAPEVFTGIRMLASKQRVALEPEAGILASAPATTAAMISRIKGMRELVDTLMEPSPRREEGVHKSEPVQIRVRGDAELDWLLPQLICHLVQERSQPDAAVAVCSGVPLVPVVIRMKHVEKLVKSLGEKSAREEMEHGSLLKALLAGGHHGGPAEESEMLLQAFEIRALMVIFVSAAPKAEKESWPVSKLRTSVPPCDLHNLTARGERVYCAGVQAEIACTFVERELVNSGNRSLVFVSDYDQVGLPPQMLCRLKLRSLSVYLCDTQLDDAMATRVCSGIRMQASACRVTSLNLGNNPLGAAACDALVHLLKQPTCSLALLDLSFVAFGGGEWESVVGALARNASLTYLDMRQQVALDNALLAHLGEDLLRESNTCKLGYIRCNPFDVLPGSSSLSMQETVELGSGPLTLLAGVLRYNDSITKLNLAATGISDNVAILRLANALSVNTSVTTLDLQHNPLAPDGSARMALEALQGKRSGQTTFSVAL
jgi:hypothetical protein